jgi:hypothetical protein
LKNNEVVICNLSGLIRDIALYRVFVSVVAIDAKPPSHSVRHQTLHGPENSACRAFETSIVGKWLLCRIQYQSKDEAYNDLRNKLVALREEAMRAVGKAAVAYYEICSDQQYPMLPEVTFYS